jgi:hypothetical protein
MCRPKGLAAPNCDYVNLMASHVSHALSLIGSKITSSLPPFSRLEFVYSIYNITLAVNSTFISIVSYLESGPTFARTSKLYFALVILLGLCLSPPLFLVILIPN